MQESLIHPLSHWGDNLNNFARSCFCHSFELISQGFVEPFSSILSLAYSASGTTSLILADLAHLLLLPTRRSWTIPVYFVLSKHPLICLRVPHPSHLPELQLFCYLPCVHVLSHFYASQLYEKLLKAEMSK